MNTNNGMRVFTIVWLGQFVSVIGTAMTRFALLIWAYQQTGSATTVALLGFFFVWDGDCGHAFCRCVGGSLGSAVGADRR